MSIILPSNVVKYLNKYGSNKWNIHRKNDDKFDCAVVVPAIAEYDNLIVLLNSLSENVFNKDYRVIIIFSVNNLVSSTQQGKDDNYKTLLLLNAIQKNSPDFHPIVKKFNSSGLAIGFIDASSEGLEMPEKTGGVGLARKIGMDLALTVFDYSIQKKKILLCLDADCTIEKNYLQEVINSFNKKNYNAAVISFEHLFPDDVENVKAIICYEIFLRYYELGLKYAGSKYAFQTVGSSMSCTAEAYTKIEGMNKQKAAEDFYFLEKLAKNYPINKINSTKVYPSSRKSWRVPFGTGQRINRYFSHTQDEYLLYNPESFYVLKNWLELFHSDNDFSEEDYLKKTNEIHPELRNFLMIQNFNSDWKKILLNTKSKSQLNLQKFRWFDGFRTLKLIHHLRDFGLPLINLFDALDIMFKNFNLSIPERRQIAIPEIPIQKEYLYTLRSFLNNDY